MPTSTEHAKQLPRSRLVRFQFPHLVSNSHLHPPMIARWMLLFCLDRSVDCLFPPAVSLGRLSSPFIATFSINIPYRRQLNEPNEIRLQIRFPN
ncbi:hypothetical protein AVEN_221211-1 [Araneus ventricosus]|uniref:Uncharacterized protein n=1 Tax=Araneus ventricosus TaxID=182803 RepID=A0A4Y2PI24_ARAVE|nr:hypothetical protein AVEN_221211-1 [Araneus ventricosus]